MDFDNVLCGNIATSNSGYLHRHAYVNVPAGAGRINDKREIQRVNAADKAGVKCRDPCLVHRQAQRHDQGGGIVRQRRIVPLGRLDGVARGFCG